MFLALSNSETCLYATVNKPTLPCSWHSPPQISECVKEEEKKLGYNPSSSYGNVLKQQLFYSLPVCEHHP